MGVVGAAGSGWIVGLGVGEGAWVGVLMAGVVAAVCLGVLVEINRRLRRLRERVQRLAEGDWSQRVAVEGPPEIAALTELINRMAQQMQERLGQVVHQRNELEAVLASMVEGVVAVDQDEHIVSLNRAAAELLNLDLVQSIGRTVPEAVRNAALHDLVLGAMRQEGPVRGEIVVHGASTGGEGPRILQGVATALRDAKGERIGAVVVLHDVSELRRLETVRRDFVANVSHEIKTPVAAIRAAAETLQEIGPENAQEAKQFVTVIVRQAQRLEALVEDLLNLARIEQDAQRGAIAMAETDLRDVAERAIESCQFKASQRQVVMENAVPVRVRARINAGLIEQALANLLDNAIKYSAEGRSVQVRLEERENELILVVQDWGCGIAPEHQSRIFERFYRVDKARSRALGGTGLGLAIVKHIVQAHQGRVSLESEVGKGSTFRIHLPKA